MNTPHLFDFVMLGILGIIALIVMGVVRGDLFIL